jgi:chromosome condensin MukBEF ATPase and DNA-binding subunit MukB
MLDMFMKIHENEKNEKTAFILMLGVLSEKLTEIIDLLSANKEKFDLIKKDLKELKQIKKELENDKFYMPLTSADYD